MRIDEQKIKELLLREHYVTSEDIGKAAAYQKAHGGSFVEFLLSQEIITKDLLGQAIAEYMRLKYADLNSYQPAAEQLELIPEDVARSLRVIPFTVDSKSVVVATDNPKQSGLEKRLKELFPRRTVTVAYSLPDDVDEALAHYQKTLETRFAKIISKQERIAPDIVDEIFADAFIYHTSDIHFDPYESFVLIRFRVDGVLHEAGKLPAEYYENLINYIKVLAHLPIDEHFTAQDGAIRYEKDEIKADMRVSIVPTLNGEKIAIRLLARYVANLSLGDLGLSVPQQRLLEDASKKPFGMILVVGPTGSGKTTTLYGLLKSLNNPDVHITTIEDPVEYKIAGINQIQVNESTKLTFGKGLRSIVRLDPDIILVGEIRDRETVEISVNAALTGHLLFSTFHANDAATAIPRLLNMGVEPFLLASTLELVVAQRLVRKICESCRYSTKFSAAEWAKIPASARALFPRNKAVYRGKGCKNCGNTGFRGQCGLFELIAVTPQVQALILQNPSSQAIATLAKKQGMRTLFEHGIEHVKNGITSFEELSRVVNIPGV